MGLEPCMTVPGIGKALQCCRLGCQSSDIMQAIFSSLARAALAVPTAPHLGRLTFMRRATTSHTLAALSSPTSTTSACPPHRRPLSYLPWARARPAPERPRAACPAPTRRCPPTTAACPTRCSTQAAPTPAARARRSRTPATPARPQPPRTATLWTPKREPSACT